jgi:NAD(P)-dependent dehydrogenase (short-subunit alcohol dehydrogenase family)/acyl dehydratase
VADARSQAATITYEDIEPGQIFEVERTFSQDDLLAFAELSGDFSPLHVDTDYAAGTEFGACVVHGVLLASLFSQLVGMRIPGRNALYLGQDLTFRRPIRVGETVRAVGKVTAKNDATRTISLATEIRDAENKVAVAGTAKVKVRGAAAQAAVPAAGPALSTQQQGAREVRVAVVTGASGGIGAAVAQSLAAKGYAVAVIYFRNAQRASEVVTNIRNAGGKASAVQCDVRQQDEIVVALSAVRQELGEPTLLVNVATGELEQKPFTDLSWANFQSHLEYQVKAVVAFCQAVYPGMKAAGGGSIVNVLSQVTGGQPPSKMADYVTAKYALAGLSRALAVEWAEDRIRVNTVSPGLVQTPLTQHYHERVFKMEASRTPLKRLATTHDVALAVSYLAGDDAGFLTGVNLFVSGGQIMT